MIDCIYCQVFAKWSLYQIRMVTGRENICG